MPLCIYGRYMWSVVYLVSSRRTPLCEETWSICLSLHTRGTRSAGTWGCLVAMQQHRRFLTEYVAAHPLGMMGNVAALGPPHGR